MSEAAGNDGLGVGDVPSKLDIEVQAGQNSVELAGNWLEAAADHYRLKGRTGDSITDENLARHCVQQAEGYERALRKLNEPTSEEDAPVLKEFVEQCAEAERFRQERLNEKKDSPLEVQTVGLKPPHFLI